MSSAETAAHDGKQPVLAAGADPQSVATDANRERVETVLEDPFNLKKRQELAHKLGAEYVSGFHEGRAFVKMPEDRIRQEDGEKPFRFINEDGIEIDQRSYDEVHNFKEGLAVVGCEKMSGVTEPDWYDDALKMYTGGNTACLYWYIDKNGEKVAGPYRQAGDFSEGVAPVLLSFDHPHLGNPDYGALGDSVYIDHRGGTVLRGPYVTGTPFRHGLAVVITGHRGGCKDYFHSVVIDKDGNELSKVPASEWPCSHQILTAETGTAETAGKTAMMEWDYELEDKREDERMRFFLQGSDWEPTEPNPELQFRWPITDFSEGLMVVESGKKEETEACSYALVNTEGAIILTFAAAEVCGPVRGGLLPVALKRQGKISLMNTKGEIVARDLFDSFAPDASICAEDGVLAVVIRDGDREITRYMDFQGNFIFGS